MRTLAFGLVITAAGCLAACSESPPNDPPAYGGVVREVNSEEILLAHDEDACGLVQVGHDGDTEILREKTDGNYEPASWDELESGQQADIWSGDEDLSCPAQTTADVIVLRDG